MFGELRPYRDRGEGGLPSGWRTERLASLGRVFKANGGSKEDDAESGVPCIRYGDLYTQYGPVIRRPTRSVDAHRASSYTQVEHGDVLFAASGETEADIGRSAVVTVEDEVVAGGDIIVFRPRIAMHPVHLGLVLDSAALRAEKAKRATGSMIVHISPGAVRTLEVPLPPRAEQNAIVKYLAHAHRRIDRAIDAKRKMIALLEEQQQVVVNQAVTRGLHLGVPMKDSGLGWLGDVPERWGLPAIGRIARVSSGSTPSRLEPRYWQPPEVPWVSSGKVNDLRITSETERISRAAQAECSLALVPAGSVAVGLVGQGRTRGMSAMLEIDACINQNLAAVVPGGSVDGEFLLLVLRVAYEELRMLGRGGNQAALNGELLRGFRVPLPPVAEQRAIVRFIDVENATAGSAISRASREVDLLKEFRTRLTADVVTGQVDVREIAARLPDIDPGEFVSDTAAESAGDLDDEAAEYLETVDA